jgi:hypothetical protein
MNLYPICVLRTGLVALITMLSACGGAGSELDAPDLTPTGAGTGASIAPATVSTPLNIAVKPVANSSSPTTAAASGAPIGVVTVSGK